VSIFNRRNAAFGWLAWIVTKKAVRFIAKDAVPKIDKKTKRPNRAAIAALVAGAVGAALVWRRLSGDGDGGPYPD
jgi:hypothetical protein